MAKYAYDHNQVETKWQEVWDKSKLFYTPDSGDSSQDQEKLYLLFAFAYPSGSGLHVGHVESKTALDILARFNRMQGKQVFFPVGWDAFGLPAENYAIKTGVHPAITTKKAINTFRRQIRRLGISYNWDHELATNHPDYYKWTQWIFLELFRQGLAYKAPGLVNWCDSCQTVLANEQVVDGACERCGTQVVQRQLDQWYFKITDYKDELISGLDLVDWPQATAAQQINWIGKKEGASIDYPVLDEQGNSVGEVTCFTTRPDTNFGATFVVLSPEHQLVADILAGKIPSPKHEGIAQYAAQASLKTELERQQDGRKKTGVFTGFYAHNRLNDTKIPVWVSDFVLSGFGTGAVVGVPGHDRRDFDFACTFNLEVKRVVRPVGLKSYRSTLMGGAQISDDQLKKIGVTVVSRQSDARNIEVPADSFGDFQELIRQKLEPGFWNEVIGDDIWFCFKDTNGKCREFVLDQHNYDQVAQLCSQYSKTPLEITQNLWKYLASNPWYIELIIFEDGGETYNSGALDGLETQEAITKVVEILTEKSWGQSKQTYRLRDWLISRQRYWGAPIPIVYDPQGQPHPVKQEHLPWVLPEDVDFNPHGESPLKTSREFVERTEKLYGKGWRPEYDTMDTFVDSSWYYLRYPMIAGTHADNQGQENQNLPFSKEIIKQWLPVDFYMIGPEHIVLHLLYSRFFTKFFRDQGLLDFDEPFMKMRHQGMILGPDHRKMSKSKGNVIDPDGVINLYGADTLRMYEMFMGPIEADKPWNDHSVVGVRRFLDRVYKLVSHELQTTENKANENESEASKAIVSKFHKTIKKVAEDITNLKFNTAIAAMMEWVNDYEEAVRQSSSEVNGSGLLGREHTLKLIKLLAPMAPFLAEELWSMAHDRGVSKSTASVHLEKYPEYDEKLIASEAATIAVAVNGKVRQVISLDLGVMADHAQVTKKAQEKPEIAKWWEGKKIVKVIFVPGTQTKSGMLNFVVV